MFSILGVPVDAAYHLVAGFTGILTPALGAVAAIIAVTMAVRIILMPLSFRALRGQAVQARLAPQLLALRQRYARQPERLQKEMSALYKREGTSMFAGFTPFLLQWPFLSVMYLLFRSPQVVGRPNTLLARDLLGVPLGTHWLSGAGPASTQGAVFLGVFALLAGLCWLSSRLGQLMTAQAAAVLPAPAKAGPGQKAKAGSATAAGAAGATDAVAGTGALAKALPYLTVLIAAFAPLAAGIYLLTSMGWSLAERKFFFRRSTTAPENVNARRAGAPAAISPHGQHPSRP
jgi:YidC/Oxa1 family membrane protein insertase